MTQREDDHTALPGQKPVQQRGYVHAKVGTVQSPRLLAATLFCLAAPARMK